MEPVAATPTSPADYMAVSAAYAVLGSGVALLASRRQDGLPTAPTELAVYALGTAGLARVLSHEKVTSWLRAPVMEEPAEGERHPRGTGMRYTLGELMGCTRCLGSWSALGLLGLRAAAPVPARLAATVLGLSAVNDVAQAVISGSIARASAEEARAAQAG